MRSFSLFSPTLVVIAITNLVTAQDILTFGTGSANIPFSVVLAPNAGFPTTLHAIVSFSTPSRQMPIDVVPAHSVAKVSSSLTANQYCRAWYSPAFSGLLFTAHPSAGGIRMWDASLPKLSPGSLAVVGAGAATNYSHEGLETYSGVLGTWLYYGEHWAPSGLGGLRVFKVGSSTTLSPAGTAFPPGGSDGNALEVDRDGRYVWQMGWTGNLATNGVLYTYDTNNKTQLVPSVSLSNTKALTGTAAYTVANYDRYLEKNLLTENTLVSTNGVDGLQCFDITNKAVPTFGSVFGYHYYKLNGNGLVLNIRGVTFIPGTDIGMLFGHIDISGVPSDFVWFITAGSPAGSFAPIPGGLIIIPGFQISDAKILGSKVYMVGKNRATNSGEYRRYPN